MGSSSRKLIATAFAFRTLNANACRERARVSRSSMEGGGGDGDADHWRACNAAPALTRIANGAKSSRVRKR
jgi:hypothetical protein